MVETILLQIVGPILITATGSYFGFKYGRKKTQSELDKDNAETASIIVNLANNQVKVAYDTVNRQDKIIIGKENEIDLLREKLKDTERELKDAREVVIEAMLCKIPSEECPVLKRQRSLEEYRMKYKDIENDLKNREDEIAARKKTDGV